MDGMNTPRHWENVYREKSPGTVSWYRPHLDRSIELIQSAAPDRTASIIDVGGGESTLVDDLLELGYRNLTILDVSQMALDVTKARLGESSKFIRWVYGDITELSLPIGAFDVWHDRALFHFLTKPADRSAYVQNVEKSLKPGGHVIVSTFGPQGPTKCSGLETMRYDAEGLQQEFGNRFKRLEDFKEQHETPSGVTQEFLYCHFRFD